MNADDPRHGTTRGYHAGCRDACCKWAIARDEKARRLDAQRGGRAIPAFGVQRRIQALMRLGWTAHEIAKSAGWTNRNDVLRILNGQKGKPPRYVLRQTAYTLCRVFEDMCMTPPPPNTYRQRNVNQAVAKGYAPTLAWDNIDDPNETPDLTPYESTRDDEYDEAAVLRLLSGEHVPARPADKIESLRRWVTNGGSARELCRIHGWKEGRYRISEAA